MLYVGSTAMRIGMIQAGYGIDATYEYFRGRLSDVDLISTYEDFESSMRDLRPDGGLYPTDNGKSFVARWRDGAIEEYMIAWPGTTTEEILHLEPQKISGLAEGIQYASLNTLLLLKLSHRYRKNSPHFLKTMKDIKVLRSLGATIEGMEDLLKRREEETYTYAHPKLDQVKSTFFSMEDSFYKYEHDDIHQAVKVGDKPAYQYFGTEGQEVKSSKRKFDKCDLRTQLLAGLEESYVLAIERSLVPHPGVLTLRQAFDKALMKVCTSITSGWFREFCWEHYDEISELYEDNYLEKFNAALARGEVRNFNAG